MELPTPTPLTIQEADDTVHKAFRPKKPVTDSPPDITMSKDVEMPVP